LIVEIAVSGHISMPRSQRLTDAPEMLEAALMSVRRLASVALVASALVAGAAQPALAQESDIVTINATVENSLTLIISNATANFDSISVNGAGGLVDQGSGSTYFLAASPVVTVLSSTAWNGSIIGTQTESESSLSITGGDLSYGSYVVPANMTQDPATLASLTGEPTDYASAGALTEITTASVPWTTGIAGLTSLAQVYALHVETSDTPGEFGAEITYSVTQGAAQAPVE
jgi:hypothetical protein